jgi:hypothetical protein
MPHVGHPGAVDRETDLRTRSMELPQTAFRWQKTKVHTMASVSKEYSTGLEEI